MGLSVDMLTTFVAVADRLSVSAAAAELGVAKSVVSKRLAQLESEIGTCLLARDTRRVSLTPAGSVYLGHARSALLTLREADEGVRALRSEIAGLIRISAPVSWGQRVIGRLLPAFLAEHPALEIELMLDDRVMDLAEDRIDLALRMSAQVSPDLVSIPLTRLDWLICAAPSYLKTAEPPMEPTDLIRHPCLNYWRNPHFDRWELVRDGHAATVKVASRYRANHPEAVVDAAVAGLGIALVPLYFVERELAEGALVRLLGDWEPRTVFGNAVSVVAMPERVRLARNQALLQFLRARLRPVSDPG